jgi:DNA polymerase-4
VRKQERSMEPRGARHESLGLSPSSWHAVMALPQFPAQAVAVSMAEGGLRPGDVFAVVDQAPDSHKTRLVAVPPQARLAGLAPGMPLYWARRSVPHLRVMQRDPAVEASLLEAASRLLEGWTPVHSVRADGLLFADLTGTPLVRKGEPAAWSATLRQGFGKLGLQRMTIALAPSQVLAHLLLLRLRENGCGVCRPGDEKEWLPSMPVLSLPGLSPWARERLRKYGLVSLGQVAALERGALRERFGADEGERLYGWSRGLDAGEWGREESVRVERTLQHDINDEEALRTQARLLADQLGHLLRERGERAIGLRLTLTYADRKQVSGSAKLAEPTQAFAPLAREVETLLRELCLRRVALRRLRLEVSRLGSHDGQQDLFQSGDSKRQDALGEAIYRIRRKQSFDSIFNAVNACAAQKPENKKASRAGRLVLLKRGRKRGDEISPP